MAKTSRMGLQRTVFIAGGTGYIGHPLIVALIGRGHTVRALVRPGSEAKLPAGCLPVPGNALDSGTYMDQVRPSETFVHLVGVSHPSPAKAVEFRTIDFVASREAFKAAASSAVRHFVYMSVAHPARTMKAYIDVRVECEALLLQTGLDVTIIRPWYVLGPGHRWPLLLKPLYWLLGQIPSTRESATRLGLVSLGEITSALIWSIENPAAGERIIRVHDIRRLGMSGRP